MQTQLFNETHNFWVSLALIDPAKLVTHRVSRRPHICCQAKQTSLPQIYLTPCPFTPCPLQYVLVIKAHVLLAPAAGR